MPVTPAAGPSSPESAGFAYSDTPQAEGQPRIEREWFVSYDVTSRRIELQRLGQDPHEVTVDEAWALREDLFAAGIAAHEHRILLGDD